MEPTEGQGMDEQPSSRDCFVCGRDNPEGLRTRWFSDRARGEVRTRIAVPERFHGYPGVVHGGIVSALLDEGMVRTALLEGAFDDLMVTARMEVTFRRSAPTGVLLTVLARRLRQTGARAQARAELVLPDGTVAAVAEGVLVRAPPEVAQAWAAERPFWRVEEG
ncbi:MAG TPA: PaaI family thioesterase [Anaeromyxobacteraceae bacterium]|nr:PaaI family thioesterase [Anaeromyxobacteraceae bacterium]